MDLSFIKSIRSRLLLITTTVMLITGIGTSVFGYVMFSRNLRDNQIHAAQSSLQFLSSDISMNLSDIINLSFISRTNNNIISFINTTPEEPSYNTITNTALEWLNGEYTGNSAKQYIDRIVVASTARSDFIQIVPATYSTGKPVVQIITELPYYEELISLPDYTFDIGVQTDPFLLKNLQMIPVIRPIYSAYDNTIVGFSYIQISFDLFTDSLQSYAAREHTEVYLTLGDTLYELDGTKIAPVSSPEASFFRDNGDYIQSATVNGKTQSFVTAPIDGSDCYISIPLTGQTFRDNLPNYVLMLVIIFCAICIIGLLLFFSLRRTVTDPVLRLQDKIHAVSNEDFSPDPSIEWDNEFGGIGRALNQMGTDIQQLMTQKIEFERQKQDYEYQVLQSQINPHFLYNTLNSIKWMATIQHAPGIAEMTTALAHLLKSIAKGTSTMVTLKDELKLLDDYFTIQKYRYGGAITLSCEMEDPALNEILVLRFTLQPIVENAIFHGIEPKGSSGHIQIRVRRKAPSAVQIDITDDGVGMTEETIRDILSEENSGKSQFFRQIGIASVHRRIQYNFGEEYGLSITSRPGCFTTMSILFPEHYMNEEKYKREEENLD